MSDLTGKFEALETQLTTQHAEIMEALNTIAYALGVPPSTPTTTLEDVVTAITASNNLLTGIRLDMNEQLTTIFDTLDIINNNASLNAQRLYLLMLQNSCPCDTEAPLLPLPIDTTPTETENTVQCQRIQYFLDMYISWAIQCGVYLDMHGNISSFQVKNLLDIVIGDVSLLDSELSHMSISTRDNLSTLLNTDDTPSAINASIFGALTNSVVVTAMRQALYSVDNASAGKDAIDTAIGANVFSHANILVAMFYSSWLNVIYSDVPEIDASAYDGDICDPIGPENCSTLDSAFDDVLSGATVVATRHAIIWPSGYTAGHDQPNGYSHSELVMLLGDYEGYRVRKITGTNVRIFTFDPAGGVVEFYLHTLTGGDYYTIPDATQSLCIDAYGSNNDAFSIEFCPPEPL